jgi:hypothetical protein
MVTPAFLLDFGARASQASENRVCTLRRHSALSTAEILLKVPSQRTDTIPTCLRGSGAEIEQKCRSDHPS